MTNLRLFVLGLVGVLAVLLTGAGMANAGSGGADLAGTWRPIDGQGNGAAHVVLAADGAWTGSDGCNGFRGSWAVGPDGRFAATAGPSTKMFCDNVPVDAWLAGAASVERDGATLVLRDAAGVETGRLAAG